MSHRTTIELLFAVLMLIVLTLSSLAPESKVLHDAPIFLVLAFAVWFDGFTRRHPEERSRQIPWLWPSLALATAAQFVWFAKDEERLKMAALGGLLVLAATGLAMLRRRRG
jgi:hypothetical protein